MDDAIREMSRRIDRMQKKVDRTRRLLHSSDEWHMDRITSWETSYCIIPRRCSRTGKLVWLKDCVTGTSYLKGVAGDEPLKVKFHIEAQAFTLWQLSKEH